MKRFDTWEQFDGANEGSGRSEKIWLQDSSDGKIALFKYKKDKDTKDHVSEKLATDIAKLVGISCPMVEIGLYAGREGSMSYLINQEPEVLIEGISLINNIYPGYDADTMYDCSRGEYYSIEMLINSVKPYNLLEDLLKMLVFDYLIGNSDRHQNNWAIIRNDKGYSFSPLYDNSSSLCCYIPESKIAGYLENELRRIRSIAVTNSRSIVRLDKYNKSKPKHEDVVKYLNENYGDIITGFTYDIILNINENSLDALLLNYNEYLLSVNRKELIKRFLLYKVKRLAAITNREEDANG